MSAFSQPNIAISSCSPTPASAARTAPILRKPWPVRASRQPRLPAPILERVAKACDLVRFAKNRFQPGLVAKLAGIKNRPKWPQDRKCQHLGASLPTLELAKNDGKP